MTSLKVQIWVLILSGLVAIYWTLQVRQPRWRAAFRALALQPYRSAVLIFLLSVSLSAVLSCLRTPLPWVHDEYSYLLASDTFSNFRLSNPLHPMWEHFESFHVLSGPTYCSKYPPGNGFALALGQLTTGRPIIGVWLSLGLACVATYWMLRAWTSPQWALVASLAIVIHAPMLRAWGQSYWGGAVAMLGGALVFGGFPRVWRQPKWRDATWLGCGMVILANTRPAEGFLASAPVLVALTCWWLRSPIPLRIKTTQVALPMLLIGTGGLGLMAAYNLATTGNVRVLPYQLHDAKYSASSLVIWKEPPEIPDYNHDKMRHFYVDTARERQLSLRALDVYLPALLRKLAMLWDFFPLGLGLGLLTIPWCWRDPWLRFATSLVGFLLGVQALLATSWAFPHYLAPLAALFYAVNVAGLRQLYVWQRERRLGQILVRAILIALVVELGLTFKEWTRPVREHKRQQVVARLSEFAADRHLVIVRYAPEHNVHDEYVYNEADIDRARIVWARDMGPEKNKRLMQYFSDRMVWRWSLLADDTERWESLPRNDCRSAHRGLARMEN